MSKRSHLDSEFDHLALIRMRTTTPSSRFACYSYLEAVYRQYRLWAEDGAAKRRSRILSRKHGVELRRGVHPVRVLITLTYPSIDPKMASRWTRALEYAAHCRALPGDLAGFFSRYGGVAGCAQMAARELPKRASDRDDWV